MALYDVLHDTTYRYDSAVLLSQQIAHLRPRERAGQHTLAHRLEIAPPAQRSERSDFFGNPVTAFALHASSTPSLRCTGAAASIEPAWPEAAASPPWETARDYLRDGLSGHAPLQADARDAGQYRFASPFVALGDEAVAYTDYALQCFTPGGRCSRRCSHCRRRSMATSASTPRPPASPPRWPRSSPRAAAFAGLLAPDDRLPARARPGRALCVRLPAHRAAARPAAADRRRRLARLGGAVVSGAGLDRRRSDQRPAAGAGHITLAWGATMAATCARCVASSSAAADMRWRWR